MRGRFLKEWAGIPAHYNAQDIARALLASMDLFR